MIEPWSREQVLALASDAASQKAAVSVSTPRKWTGTGVTTDAIWGECAGSGAKPYRACVDLTDVAYRCTCPSRKFPCKHAVALLLLWSAEAVPPASTPPPWVTDWLTNRRARAERSTASPATSTPEKAGTPAPGAEIATAAGTRDAMPTSPTAARREERVSAGLSELERWLADQIRQGIAGARQTGPAEWEDLAKRLIDAQAPGVAGIVSRLPGLLREDDWPERLLAEYGLVHLLSVAYRRSAELPADLRETVRSRVGFTVPREHVLSQPPIRDVWDVIGARDEIQDRLISRRVWLHGRTTHRSALVLTFTPVGQPIETSALSLLVTGTAVDADVTFYPGAAPLRALVAHRHNPVAPAVPTGLRIPDIPHQIADSLAADPWLESWPIILANVTPTPHSHDEAAPSATPDLVTPAAGRWALADADTHEALPLHPAMGVPWRLLAVSGGHPVTVAAEWTPRGLRLLTTWDEENQAVAV